MSENRNQNSGRPQTQRAEQWLDRAGQTAGMFASMAGLRLARIGSFAREEFEDMWAEAQALRRAQGDGQPSETAEAVNKAAETVGEATSKATETVGEATSKAAETVREATSEAAEKASEAKPSEVGSSGTAKSDGKSTAGSGAKTPQATESARKWAEKLGVDLQTVKGTGMEGQITVEDVRKKSQ